jgi:cytoskeletal protein CcmA (bactofilin family)
MHGGGERWAMALGIGMPFDSRVGSQEPLVISTSADINGSVTTDTIVQNNCSLHVRGNLIGNLTIDPGAEVVVDGSVDGKIVNRGGRLVVNHKGLAAFVTLNGPSENWRHPED